MDLPGGLRIFNSDSNTWLGGSEDGEILLHVERMPEDVIGIPNVFADGDLDLYLCSNGMVEAFSEQMKGVNVTGTFGSKPIQGYLTICKVIGVAMYVVLTAAKAVEETIDLRHLSLDITNRIGQNFLK